MTKVTKTKVRKPIVIVGTGRCGSTMLHRLLALHPDVGWLSPFNELFPTQGWLSRFSNLYRVMDLGERVRHLPFFPKPFEAYRFWEHYLPGFSRRDRPQTADDVPAEAIQPVHQVVGRVLQHQDRRRFLVKVTGWARIAYFDRIFPDARFIWLDRECRAVVSSWVRAGWLDVTSPPDSPDWQWGPVPRAYEELWRELGSDPLLSASLKIQMDLDDIRRNVAQFPERTIKLQFEDLITEPVRELRRLCQFCELDWTQAYERVIESHHFYDPTDKWRRHLSDEDGQRVLEFFRRAQHAQVVLEAGD